MNQKIDIIHTPCKDCVFAVYDGNTQISCLTGSLERYKNSGIEVLEAYDDTKEFFILNKKKCLSYRDNKWLQKQESSDLLKACEVVLKENEIKYIAVLYIEEDTDLDQFTKILDCLQSQSIKPKGLMVIQEKYKKYKISVKDITPLLNKTGIHWRLQNFIDESMTKDRRIQSIIKSAPLDRFYFLIYPSQYVFDNYIEKISKYINDGHSFGCININNNLFFSYLTYMYVMNMKNTDLLSDKTAHIFYETIS
jgi:hypothetical protein